MEYSCLIVDDELLARQLIEAHVNETPGLSVVKTCANAIEAGKYLESNTVDILFLDIQMPRLSGIDFLRGLTNPPKVIFTTAYSEFALEGYELNVVDYLLKPIEFERFSKAVNKAMEIVRLERDVKEDSSAELKEKAILIKSSHQLIKVDIHEILYVEGLHKYVKIVTPKKTHTTLFSLTAMEAELPNTLFYRCHRSFIVNLEQVEMIDGNTVILGEHNVPVSKNNKAELIDKLGRKIG